MPARGFLLLDSIALRNQVAELRGARFGCRLTINPIDQHGNHGAAKRSSQWRTIHHFKIAS